MSGVWGNKREVQDAGDMCVCVCVCVYIYIYIYIIKIKKRKKKNHEPIKKFQVYHHGLSM